MLQLLFLVCVFFIPAWVLVELYQCKRGWGHVLWLLNCALAIPLYFLQRGEYRVDLASILGQGLDVVAVFVISQAMLGALAYVLALVVAFYLRDRAPNKRSDTDESDDIGRSGSVAVPGGYDGWGSSMFGDSSYGEDTNFYYDPFDDD